MKILHIYKWDQIAAFFSLMNEKYLDGVVLNSGTDF